MSLAVITNLDTGTPVTADVLDYTTVFAPLIAPMTVTTDKLGVDGNEVALEADIDSTLATLYTTPMATAGLQDTSTGTVAYNSITGITVSSKLTKGGTGVVLKVAVDFDMLVVAPGFIVTAGGAPSSIYITGLALDYILNWTVVQSKLVAAT